MADPPPPRPLLPFQRRAVDELVEADGLCVLAAGLGWAGIVGAVLRLQVRREESGVRAGLPVPGRRARAGVQCLLSGVGWRGARIAWLPPRASSQQTKTHAPPSPSLLHPCTLSQVERRRLPGQRGAAIVVGAADWQRDLILGELADLVAAGAGPTAGLASTSTTPPPAIAALSADTPAALRAHLYATAGVVFATTRILCVDLLSGVAAGPDVAGLLVLRAHRATAESGEGFAARLVRRAAPRAWLRAVSDSPAAFTAGFARAERVMRALGATALHLWPRFEAGVKADLAAAGARAQVVDLAVSLTPAMGACYEALVDLMEACLRELRRCARLDGAGLTLDRGLGPAFDAGVARQLDAAWDSIPLRTKQAAADMRTLRGLASDLLALDCVSFLRRLEALRAADAPGAGGAAALGGGGWMLHDAAHALFAAARRRVYVVGRPDEGGGGAGAAAAPAEGGGPAKRRRGRGGAAASAPDQQPSPSPSPARSPASTSTPTTIIPVLEEQPKWAVVLDILREVQAHRERLLTGGGGANGVIGGDSAPSQDSAGGGPPSQRAAAADAPVLVVARDARTVAQLTSAAAAGGAGPVLRALYEEWLAGRAAAAAARKGGGGSDGGGRGRGGGPATATAPSRALGRGTPAERLAAMRAGRLRGPAGEEAALLREAEGGGLGRGGRGRGGEGGPRGAPPPPPAPPSPTDPATTPHLLQGVTFACLDAHEAAGALVAASPAFLVVVDPDVALVRQVEVWSAGRPGWAMRVYHLRYEASLEADRYGAALAREGRAMEGLIEAKAHMAMPGAADDDEHGGGGGGGPFLLSPGGGGGGGAAPALPPSGDAGNDATRVGGGGLAASRAGGGPATTLVGRATAAAGALARAPPRRGVVVVDAREFMSSLPAVLHRAGLTLAPVTLEVGDYVLSPTLAVERKAIPDLRASLASGRALTQASALTRHYRTAALLIEFDGDRAFGLDPSSSGEGGGFGAPSSSSSSTGALSAAAAAAAARSLPARLTLLTLHAPRLRLLWARSPPAAARLFLALKAGSASGEPDPAAAAAVGLPDGEEEGGGGAGGGGSMNEPAIDLLRRLPGVSEANLRPLMAAAGSLAGLAGLSLADLEAAMGGAGAARKLRGWLDSACPAVG